MTASAGLLAAASQVATGSESSGSYSEGGVSYVLRKMVDTTGLAEVKALSGMPLTAVELSDLCCDRVVLCGLLGGGSVETATMGHGTDAVCVVDIEPSTVDERNAVITAFAETWNALAKGSKSEAGNPWLFALAGVAVVALAGAAAYVLRDVVPQVIAGWTVERANQARVKELLRADAELADAVSKHEAAEQQAGHVLPLDDALKAKVDVLKQRQRELVSGIQGAAIVVDSSSWSTWIWMGVALGGVALLSSKKYRRRVVAAF